MEFVPGHYHAKEWCMPRKPDHVQDFLCRPCRVLSSAPTHVSPTPPSFPVPADRRHCSTGAHLRRLPTTLSPPALKAWTPCTPPPRTAPAPRRRYFLSNSPFRIGISSPPAPLLCTPSRRRRGRPVCLGESPLKPVFKPSRSGEVTLKPAPLHSPSPNSSTAGRLDDGRLLRPPSGPATAPSRITAARGTSPMT
jgi:hypothetical protein